MSNFLGFLVRQNWYKAPVNRWGGDKFFSFLVDAESWQAAVDILTKQARLFCLDCPDGVRFVVGQVKENPSEDWLARAKPVLLQDPLPDVVLQHTRHPYLYIQLDDESRFHPGDKTGSGLEVIVVKNADTGVAVYTSAADGRLYMTSGADKKRTIPQERLDMIESSFPFYPLLPGYEDKDGTFSWEDTVPDLSALPLTRMWLQAQENMP